MRAKILQAKILQAKILQAKILQAKILQAKILRAKIMRAKYAGQICGHSSVVEHHVANVRVVGSNPTARYLLIILKGSISGTTATRQSTLSKRTCEGNSEATTGMYGTS